MHAHSEPTSFIVAETGVDGAPWSHRYGVGTPSLVCIAQASNEAPVEFAVRVRETVRAFVDGGGTIARAVLLGCGDTGAERMSSRSLTLRALVAPMVSEGEGTMVLHPSGEDRFSMRALAETVASQIAGTGVVVTATSATDVADVA